MRSPNMRKLKRRKKGMNRMMGWETNGEMEQHLLYHKALIEDNVEAEKIDRYMRILAEDVGETMPDPVDESIRSVFRMVLDHDFNPWSIDLSEFVRLYTDKISDGNVDIIVAGKLVHMAWKVLRMQSDATLMESERYEETVMDWGFDFDPEFFDETESLYVPSIALQQAFHRSPTRPVTMIELLDAFEDAREEIEMQIEREVKRQELKAKEPRMSNTSHDDDGEKEVEAVWSRIEKLGTGAFTVSDLYTSDLKDNITTFLSVLVLVRDGKLAIWQDEMPYGEIFIEIKTDWMSGIVEDEPEQVIRGEL